MVPEVAAALIGGAASLGAGAISGASAAMANRRAFKWSKKYFDYQNQYNLLNYSPAANMQRLRDAGINPHEVSGSPGSGTSMQGSMSVPDYQNPVDPLANSLPAAMQQAFEIYKQKKMLDNNTDLVKSQIQKNTAEAAKTNYQVANIMPFQSEYEKNRQKIPLYQIGAYKLQNQKLMNEISMFSMQKEKYQLGLDLLKLEKQYQEEYYKYRNMSVKYQAFGHKYDSGMKKLDLHNYQSFGIRPQDPYYMRIGTNIVDTVKSKGLKGAWNDFKDFLFGDDEN